MADSTQPFRSRQPGKAFWIVLAITHVIVRMFFLSIYYLPKFTRPLHGWTYRQALVNELLRTSFYHMTITRFLLPISMEAGAEKERFVTMEPKGDIYLGPLGTSSVQPATLGATWYPNLYNTGDKDSTVILHFHGGSFLWGQGRQADCGFAASTLVKHISATALFVQYRLAYDPACPFPAAVQDALTAYKYLLDTGFPASKIVLSGDSAGGNIAIALLRYLSAPEDHELPSPAALLLWSPSVDLASQLNPSTVDHHKNNKTDYLTGFTLVWGVSSYVPKSMQASDPYLSANRHPFATKTPIWVMVGGAEVLYDSIVSFYNQMRSVGGNRLELYEVPNANHDILFVGHVTGWVREAEEAARAAAKFLQDKV